MKIPALQQVNYHAVTEAEPLPPAATEGRHAMSRRMWFESLNCGRIIGALSDGSLALCTRQHGHDAGCSTRPATTRPIPESAETFTRETFRALCAERWAA